MRTRNDYAELVCDTVYASSTACLDIIPLNNNIKTGYFFVLARQ